MHNYKKLDVWMKSRLIVKDVYVMSAIFPVEERFGLTSQIRRAAISISNNIAEGAGKNTGKDFCNFLDTALGSSFEVENLTFLSFDLNYIDEKKQDEILGKTSEIQKMIIGLINKIGRK